MKKVLLVDDKEINRRLLSIHLVADYEVFEACNGIQALEIIKHEKPYAVLLDIMMWGELDGLQVLNAIKTDPCLKEILVAMVTVRDKEKDIKVGEKYGADAYFSKPFDTKKILHWLRTGCITTNHDIHPKIPL